MLCHGFSESAVPPHTTTIRRPHYHRIMQGIRALFRFSKPSPSLETRADNISINAPSSTFNNVGGDQYNITNIHHSSSTLTSSPRAQPSHVVPFNDAPIDQLSIHFTGRKRELALIANAFNKRRRNPSRCVLFGNQGVGKSQLTYEWANATYVRKENSYILWISATTVEKLYQGFSRLLRFIDHPDRSHSDEGARLEAARRWLEGVKTGNWLLILDNVFPETLDFLRQNLPRQNGRGTILFTTRTERVALALSSTAGERHAVIEVPLLDVKAGVELFCGHFESATIDPSSVKIEAIVMAVGCLPLAIAHAAGYVIESHISLDDMLALYQSRGKIDVISWEHTLSDYEHKSVTATFSSQLQDLEQHCLDAGKLLRIIAFFDPENIPLEMLITGAKILVDAPQRPTRSPLIASLLALILSPIARQNAITHLQSRCLVTFHAGSECPAFRIHDLIQLVVLENTKRSELGQDLFDFAVELACAAFGQIESVRSHQWWPRCELLVPHIQSLTLRQETSSKAKRMLLLANRHRASYLNSRGRYAEAESLYENVVADRKRLFGPNDPDTLAVMNGLAWVYQCRGRYFDAETLFKQVLKSSRAQLGPEHRDTLNTMINLAQLYHRQQRSDEAETLLKQALQSQQFQYGSEDNNTLMTMNILAVVYLSQQRYDEANSLLTGVLLAQENLLGSEHINTLHTKHALANVYISQQQYSAAVTLLQQVLSAWETNLGSQHPNTLAVMYSLAIVHLSQGRYRDAENLLVHVLAADEQMFGPSHPHTQMAIKQLARLYEESGQLPKAKILKQRISPLSS